MNESLSDAASALLELETIQRQRTFSQAEQEKWESLANLIFKEKSEISKKRKSYRLSIKERCWLKVGEKIFEANILSMSLRGFAFGPIPKPLMIDHSLFHIDTVQKGSSRIQLGLQCKCVYTTPKSNLFGAKITDGNSPLTLGVYIDKVYYPNYISFLENLKNSI